MTARGFNNSLLARQVENPGLTVETADTTGIGLRTAVRALPGMQKEALIVSTRHDRAWHMLCDEGPYLNGTDLAPPPLAYFSAGMASLFADAIEAYGVRSGNKFHALEIVQDNRYSMEGSALRGTMTGGALPVELAVRADTETESLPDADILNAIVGSTSAEALMVKNLVDTFTLTHNHMRQTPGMLTESTNAVPADPLKFFDHGHGQPGMPLAPDVVSKLTSTESVFETDHGAGAGMKAEQKRELHIRSVLTLLPSGQRDIRVQIFKPVGSVFGFVTEPSTELNDAPDGYTLISAGIAFCFMTQIGRFAGITKMSLDQYSVIQDTRFDVQNSGFEPVDTHVFIDSQESTEKIQHLITMGEQTCFLHAACRDSNPSRIVGVSG